jgi:hypothetical protein
MLGWPLIDLITCPRLSLRSHAALPWGGQGNLRFPLTNTYHGCRGSISTCGTPPVMEGI